jgi:hypothetical protein
MATVKVHIGSFEEDGVESCDFRGRGELQASDGDHHSTIHEEEFGPNVTTNERIEEVLRDGPAWNRMNKSLFKNGLKLKGPLAQIASALGRGDAVEIRVGVFDQ